jgi:uncharacterized protein
MTPGDAPSRPCPAEEIYVLNRADGRRLIYAPLRGAAAVVNAPAAVAVARYLKEGAEGLAPAESRIIDRLREQGLLGGEPAALPLFPEKYVFCPHEVTLFLTSRCNLRCRYCYANAGHKSVEMPWDVARAAIDLACRNAGLLGNKSFAVGFHGGGEPTMAWEMLKRCVDHGERVAEEAGLDVEFFCATNGLLSAEQCAFIVQHFHTINVSLDGPADIQDFNRPRAGGGGSFAGVSDTLHRLDKAGFHYGVRATVTQRTVSRMVEVVERLRELFNITDLQLEPVWRCGRCVTSGESAPEDDAFCEGFLLAARRGRELGVTVSYSGARLGILTSKFCAAAGDGFNVLPEGIVTSCYEITDPEDTKAPVFHYGHFDFQNHSFAFDSDRLERLRKLSVEHLPFCADCFCKWHCAGDCLSKAFDHSGAWTHQGTQRCGLNRSLMMTQLEQLMEETAPAPSQNDHA